MKSITVTLTDKAEQYLNELLYSLTDGEDNPTTESQCISESLETLFSFEKATDNQLLNWLNDFNKLRGKEKLFASNPISKWEERAKQWEDKMPNLAKALRSKSVHYTCEDIDEFGWVRCITDYPPDEEQVLITDGKEVWLGDYDSKRSLRDGKWALVYDGAPPFNTEQIVAWTFKPFVPDFPTTPVVKQ